VATVGGDARSDPVALKVGFGGAAGGTYGDGMLVVESLLKAALGGGEDGPGLGILWRLAAWGGVISGVGSTTSAVDL